MQVHVICKIKFIPFPSIIILAFICSYYSLTLACFKLILQIINLFLFIFFLFVKWGTKKNTHNTDNYLQSLGVFIPFVYLFILFNVFFLIFFVIYLLKRETSLDILIHSHISVRIVKCLNFSKSLSKRICFFFRFICQ